MSRSAKFFITLTFLLAVLSLGLNGYLIWQLLIFREYALELQGQAQELQQVALQTLSRSIQELESFDEATFEYTIHIDKDIPVEAVIPFQESIRVPVQATIPIREEINTTISINISQFGLTIPLDVTIPVVLDAPVDMTVPVDIDRQVSISTTVPLKLDVPVVIHLSETELPQYLDVLKQGLRDIERALSGVGE